MRFVNVRELKSKTSEILRAAAGEDIIVTNHGKPVAVVAGIDGGDFEKIGFRGGASQGTSLRLATRPWLISTGEYGGSEPPGKARGPGRRRVSEARAPYRMEAEGAHRRRAEIFRLGRDPIGPPSPPIDSVRAKKMGQNAGSL